jgi:hypothetical protein
MSAEITTYRITQGTALFHEINTLMIALQSVAMAAELVMSGQSLPGPNEYLTIEARHLNVKLRLPLFGPVQDALANRLPDTLDLMVVAGRDREREYAHQTSGFLRFVNAIFLPFLVTYYERYKCEMESRYSAGRTHWPLPWQMGWAIRNAASHNGRVFDKATRKPVEWRGLRFSPQDEPARSILELVNGGDLLVLMIEMEELRTGASLKCA